MSRIFNEKFEGTGYDESGWSENVGAGSTIDEDAASSDVGSPSNWGSKCLKIIDNIHDDYTYNQTGANAITYWRVEIYVSSESLGDEESCVFIDCYNNAVNAQAWGIYLYQAIGGVRHLGLNSYHDGTVNQYISFITFALNTRYRIEVKWDATNNKWSWKVNGVVQPNDQDSTSPVTTEGTLTSTHVTDAGGIILGTAYPPDSGYTCYYDLVACDNADWVGAEGWIGKVMSVTNPAKIMGVAVADIKKVMGVE